MAADIFGDVLDGLRKAFDGLTTSLRSATDVVREATEQFANCTSVIQEANEQLTNLARAAAEAATAATTKTARTRTPRKTAKDSASARVEMGLVPVIKQFQIVGDNLKEMGGQVAESLRSLVPAFGLIEKEMSGFGSDFAAWAELVKMFVSMVAEALSGFAPLGHDVMQVASAFGLLSVAFGNFLGFVGKASGLLPHVDRIAGLLSHHGAGREVIDQVPANTVLDPLQQKYAAEAAGIARMQARVAEAQAATAKAVRGIPTPVETAASSPVAASSSGSSMFSGFSAAIKAIVPALESLKQATLAVISGGLKALTQALAKAAVAVATTVAVATGGLSAVIGLVIGALRMLVDAVVGTARDVIVSLANPLQLLANGFRMAAAPTAAMAGAMSSAIRVITGSLMGPFQQLASAVGPFVQALNPGLMRLFHQSVRDLMATFGVAFQPVIQHIISMFRALSATLTPLMHTLAPIVDDLMSRVEGVMIPMVGIVADAFRMMAPAIKFVTGIIADVVEAMRVIFAVIQATLSVAFDAARKALGFDNLKDVGKQIQDVIRDLMRWFILFAGTIARAIGQLDPFIAAVQKNLRNLQGEVPGTKAAPEHFRMSNLESLSKDLAVAAFGAQVGVGGRKASEIDYLKNIDKMLEELKNGADLQEMLEQAWEQIKTDVEAFLRKQLGERWEEIKKWWNNEGAQKLGEIIRQVGGAAVPGNASAAAAGFLLKNALLGGI